MSALDVAKQFFAACEAGKGAAGCQAFMADGATFSAQSEPIAEITTLAGYCDWMRVLAEGILTDARYDLHTTGWDEANQTATFVATFHGTHLGDQGPVPATKKATASHYVYMVQMNADGKVAHMIKVWNAPWAMRELGWA